MAVMGFRAFLVMGSQAGNGRQWQAMVKMVENGRKWQTMDFRVFHVVVIEVVR